MGKSREVNQSISGALIMFTIEKSNSSFGNYVIRLSQTEFKFFFRKKDAINYLRGLQ